MDPQDAFLGMLAAAMKDALLEGKLTQLQTELDPTGKGKRGIVRIIVIPEKMKWEWPSYAPLGTKTEGN